MTALLAAAPQLRELHAAVKCSPVEAVGLLESRAPFAPLRLHTLFLSKPDGFSTLSPALAVALADARLQPRLARLVLLTVTMRAPEILDALADAVIARPRCTSLCVCYCDIPVEAAPGWVRMLRDGALTQLELIGATALFHNAAASAAVGDALRASSTLTSLTMRQASPAMARTVAVFVRALVGHRSVRKLDVGYCRLGGDDGAPAALAALLAADAPALTELSVEGCLLREAGLGRLCDALPRNSHLRKLVIRENGVPAGFMRRRLLPAVRANGGLRELHALSERTEGDDAAAARAAQRIGAAR